MGSVQGLMQNLHSIYDIYLDEVLNLRGKPVKQQVASRLHSIEIVDTSNNGEDRKSVV